VLLLNEADEKSRPLRSDDCILVFGIIPVLKRLDHQLIRFYFEISLVDMTRTTASVATTDLKSLDEDKYDTARATLFAHLFDPKQ
jgi:hypothetical protein